MKEENITITFNFELSKETYEHLMKATDAVNQIKKVAEQKMYQMISDYVN